MRLLPIVAAITVAAALSVPYFVGLKCKTEFYEKIALASKQLPPELQNALQITAYHSGWFSSTAQITIASPNPRYGAPDISFNSVIHHGPFISANGKFKLGFAVVDTTLALPEMYQTILQQMTGSNAPLLTITSDIENFGEIWKNHYAIHSINIPGTLQWDGLQGDLTLKTENHQLIGIDNQMLVGSMKSSGAGFGVPDINTSPIIYNQSLKVLADNGWKGDFSVSIDGVTATDNRGFNFMMNNLRYQLAGTFDKGLSSYQTNAKLAMLQLPASYTLNKLSNLNSDIEINNINLSEYANPLVIYSDRAKLEKLFHSLTKDSNIKLKAGTDSNLGSVTMQMQIALSDKPAHLMQLGDKIKLDINIAAAAPFVEYAAANAMHNEDIKTILDALTAKGYLVKQDNNYYLALSYANNQIKVNNVPPTDVETFMTAIIPIMSPAGMAQANTGSLTNQSLQMMQGIAAAADSLAQKDGSFLNSDVTQENIKALLPNNSLATPWGTVITFTPKTTTSYLVVIPAMPPEVCSSVKARIQPNPHFQAYNDNTCSGTADFHYVYDSTGVQTTSPAAPTAKTTSDSPYTAGVSGTATFR